MRGFPLVFRHLRQLGRSIRREGRFYRELVRHPRTPRLARWCIGLAVGYVLMPFDLVPDWIPVVGFLDDLVIVPALLGIGIWLVPPDVIAASRRAAADGSDRDAPVEPDVDR